MGLDVAVEEDVCVAPSLALHAVRKSEMTNRTGNCLFKLLVILGDFVVVLPHRPDTQPALNWLVASGKSPHSAIGASGLSLYSIGYRKLPSAPAINRVRHSEFLGALWNLHVLRKAPSIA